MMQLKSGLAGPVGTDDDVSLLVLPPGRLEDLQRLERLVQVVDDERGSQGLLLLVTVRGRILRSPADAFGDELTERQWRGGRRRRRVRRDERHEDQAHHELPALGRSSGTPHQEEEAGPDRGPRLLPAHDHHCEGLPEKTQPSRSG